ncbi:hypothetical protein F5Y08DRAFT_344973 [Xylaria arbuscula]|nr:hypothetical protein F5Y08DRAFT_344973 [Xylaria arbuscula]
MPSKRDRAGSVDWVNDANGQLIMTFSDEKTNMGTVSVQDIMDILNGACSETGNCDTNEGDVDGQIIDGGRGGEVLDITVTVTPGGAFPTWIHNGLLETLHAALDAAAECEEVTHTDDCVGTGLAYCPEHKITVNQCKLPKYFAVNYQAEDASNAAPPFIEAKLGLEVESNGFCAAFATIGGAIAGAVNGAAGGVFSLIGLACQ